MRAVNLAYGAVLATSVLEARTLGSRLKGLLGTDAIPEGSGLWLAPCRSIHSFGMRYEFDAVFLDPRDRVVGLLERFPRNRVSPVFWKAVGVLELPPGTVDRTLTRVGDFIELDPPPEGRPR